MSEKTIEQKVRDIIVEQLGSHPDQIKLESRFREDLGTDSLDEVELVMAAEEEFGVEISEEDAEKVVTVQDVITLITRLTA
jgi:acyl carrier protein